MTHALTNTERALLRILWSAPEDSPRWASNLYGLLNSPERSLFLENAESQFNWLERIVSWWARLPNLGDAAPPWGTPWEEVKAAVRERLGSTYPLGDRYAARLQDIQQGASRDSQAKNAAWVARETARLEREFGESDDKEGWLRQHPQVKGRAVEGIAGMLFEEYEIETVTVQPLPVPPVPTLPGLPEHYPMARDFLDVVTPLALFALVHLCHEAAVNTVREELLGWTETGYGNEPSKAVRDAFEGALQSLSTVHRSTNGVGWQDGGGATCSSCSSTSMA
jgi:hypothetical protein